MELGKTDQFVEKITGGVFVTTQQILDSFYAFNVNAWMNIVYVFRSNFWLVLIAASAIATIVLSLKEEVESVVTEEQNII